MEEAGCVTIRITARDIPMLITLIHPWYNVFLAIMNKMSYKNRIIALFHPYYRKIVSLLRKSHLLAHLLFGVRNYSRKRLLYWDWTTLCLRKALKQDNLQDRHFLDMGCGSAAVLSIFVYRRKCRVITAVDIDPAAIRSAREILLLNGVKTALFQSDLTENLPAEKYDIISFNSPYVPEKWGRQQHIESPCTTWCGGEEGTEVINRFLRQIPGYMAPGGKILLGFNTFYVKAEKVKEIIQANRLVLSRVIKLPFITSLVFEILREENE